MTFAEDEDAARQHIQELSDEYKFQDGGDHKACRIAQKLLHKYGIT